MIATSFAPGHISAFFDPYFYKQDIERCGSRGSGLNISLGATTQVRIENSTSQYIDIIINKRRINSPVTKLAIKHIIGENPFLVIVNTKLDLPVGQGFGMSAAGALSTTISMTKILNLSRDIAVKAAHFAEVESKTGLGDVIASSFGGIEIRREAGLPPWGIIEHIPGKYEIVLCIIGKKIETKKILLNEKKICEISYYGKYCVKKLIEKPTIENLFYLSQLFSKKTSLANSKIQQAIETANKFGMSSMCMLGNSIFAIGNTNELCKALSNFGKVYITAIDEYGARIIQ